MITPQMYPNVFNVPFPISVIAWAIPSRFSGRASDRSVTVRSEDNKRRFFYAYKNYESNEKETKERMDIFMVESGKEIKIGFGINTRKNEMEENKP